MILILMADTGPSMMMILPLSSSSGVAVGVIVGVRDGVIVGVEVGVDEGVTSCAVVSPANSRDITSSSSVYRIRTIFLDLHLNNSHSYRRRSVLKVTVSY